MSVPTPQGYLGSDARIVSGPAPQMVEAGYAMENADAVLLHRGLGLADLVHLFALHQAKVVPDTEAARLATELLELATTPAESFPYDPLYGDAYNSRERELERRLGRTAGWLHTGRTRREAGRIAFRLALRDRTLDLHEAICDLATALSTQAAAHAGTLWADHTYLQPAQPSTFGHYLGSFAEEARRHLDRLEIAYRLVDRSPAGSGGVGGPRVGLDREELARRLGFAEPGAQTRDAMWAVDAVTDVVVAAVHAAVTADRLAEDLEIFASPGFGHVTLDASLCRASVLMPQKRNPYALAVIRAHAGTLIGRLTGMLVTSRTPSARTDNWLNTYREAAGSLDLGRQVAALGAEVVRTLQVDAAAMGTAGRMHFIGSADLTEELVLRTGVDYRSAYRVVGHAVAAALKAGQAELNATGLERSAQEVIGRSLGMDGAMLAAALDPQRIVATRTVTGGSAPERVREHCAQIDAHVAAAARWRRERRSHNSAAEARILAEARALAARPPPLDSEGL